MPAQGPRGIRRREASGGPTWPASRHFAWVVALAGLAALGAAGCSADGETSARSEASPTTAAGVRAPIAATWLTPAATVPNEPDRGGVASNDDLLAVVAPDGALSVRDLGTREERWQVDAAVRSDETDSDDEESSHSPRRTVAVVGDLVVVAETDGGVPAEPETIVTSYAAEDGERRWRTTIAGSGTVEATHRSSVSGPARTSDVLVGFATSAEPLQEGGSSIVNGTSALDPSSGKVRWRRVPGVDAFTADGGFVTRGRGELLGGDLATGTVRWRRRGVFGQPAVVGTTAVASVLTGPGEVQAVDAATGEPRWTSAAALPSTNVYRVDDSVGVSDPDGRLLLLDSSSGRRTARSAEALADLVDGGTPPLSFSSQADPGLALLGPRSGVRRADIATESISQVATVGDLVFVVQRDGVAALDRGNLRTRWQYRLPGHITDLRAVSGGVLARVDGAWVWLHG